MKTRRNPSRGGFVNVDLEVAARTRAQLTPLINEFDGKLAPLWRGRVKGQYGATYEARNFRLPDATATIHELAHAIESLSTSGRRAWRAASMRDFDVGVELARGERMLSVGVEPDAVRRVAALGGRIVFTVYRV
jgi:hypothetical protein